MKNNTPGTIVGHNNMCMYTKPAMLRRGNARCISWQEIEVCINLACTFIGYYLFNFAYLCAVFHAYSCITHVLVCYFIACPCAQPILSTL